MHCNMISALKVVETLVINLQILLKQRSIFCCVVRMATKVKGCPYFFFVPCQSLVALIFPGKVIYQALFE